MARNQTKTALAALATVDAQADAPALATVDAQADAPAATLQATAASMLASMSQAQLAALLAAMATGNTAAPAAAVTLGTGNVKAGIGAHVMVACALAKGGVSGALFARYARVGHTVAHAKAACGMRSADISFDMLNVRKGGMGINPVLLGLPAGAPAPMVVIAAPGTPAALAAVDILAGAQGDALASAQATIAAYLPALWQAQCAAAGINPLAAPCGKAGAFTAAPAPVLALASDAQADAPAAVA